ncbi:MAG TPA: UDP-N-acetylmuramate--L-alanine ligase [Ktedonobacteraceae bacterium]|nr:UDP-N-acetylmuramate--L-alanine ligase [Ktedonobacteraceae bacterium]
MKVTGYRQLKKMRLHFMGIGGQGISAVAQMALAAGVTVSGCDQASSATTKMLEKLGIPIEIGHDPAHLEDVDALIYVPAAVAFNPNNPELLAARERGLVMMTWQEMLGQWLEGYCLLSVSGVHGKGTTTAMLALALVDAGLDPTCEIGAVVPSFGANYRIGQSNYFVNEADEFNNNFWHYHPRLAVVTSIEFEHPEFFANYAEYLASFEHFVRGMDTRGNWPFEPTLIVNVRSAGCRELLERVSDWPGRILTYAVEEDGPVEADFVASHLRLEGETSFQVRTRMDAPALEGREISLRLPGSYNIENALAALSAATSIGLDPEITLQAIENFGGTRRRFELRNREPLSLEGQKRDVLLVDDYAHHPTAIERVLGAAKLRYQGRRLIAVYQPHMYSRTRTFFAQFLKAFDQADEIIIVDIYPGREHDTGLVSSRELVEALSQQEQIVRKGIEIRRGGSVRETAELLRKILRDGDLAIIMGAGDVYQATEQLLQETTRV